jgi:methylthioribose-1-phosphate isomerase
VKWQKVSTPEDAFEAIKSMKVSMDLPVSRSTIDNCVQIRGAPAIASLAALSLRTHMAQSAFSSPSAVTSHLSPILDYLQSSRPTAVNLGEAMDRIRSVLATAPSGGEAEAKQLVDKVIQVCGAVHEEDLERNMTMGRLGAEWLWNKRKDKANGAVNGAGEKKGLKVVTVCNTGSLATSVSLGSAAYPDHGAFKSPG